MRKLVHKIGIAVLVASAVAIAGPAVAVGTLDQSVTGTTVGWLTTTSVSPVAQSFTAGLSGTLDRVTLSLMRSGTPGSWVVEIRTVSAGKPSTTVLASEALPQSAVLTSFTDVAIDFTTPAVINAGTQYAIVISIPTLQPSWNVIRWGIEPGELLTTGKSFAAISWNENPGYDLRFASYVTVPSTPSPTQTPTPTPTSTQTVAGSSGMSSAIASAPEQTEPAALPSTGPNLVVWAVGALSAIAIGAFVRRWHQR